MFDRHLLPLQRRLLHPLARRIAASGVTADAVSLVGFGLGVGGVALIAMGQFALALALILANRLLDGLDGEVARLNGPTDRGAFLDLSLDFVFYALVPLGFAIHDPAANGLAAAALVVSFVGTGSSFLAFAAIAERRCLTSTAFPQKGLYYLGGLAEGAETILAFVLMCLLPAHFPTIAWAFAALCAVGTLLRWRWGYVTFTDEGRGE
jgi:phosphatidylglycerophosphate synthase